MGKESRIRWVEACILVLLNVGMVFILATRTGFLSLDTSTVVELSSKFFQSPWVVYVIGGRFFPALYVFFAFWGTLFGFSPQSLLVGQFLLYALAALLVFWMLSRWGIRRWVKWTLYLLFFLQWTAAENLFTVGKGEVFLLSFTIAVVALLYVLAEKSFSTVGRLILYFSLFLAMLCLTLSKETSLSILAFLTVLAFFSFFSFSSTQYKRTVWISCGLWLAAFLCYRWLRGLVLVADSGYVQLQLSFPSILNALKFYLRQCPDLFLYGAASLVMCLGSWFRGSRSIYLRMGCALLIWGAAYSLMMLLWRYALTYYMLFPTGLFLLSIAVQCADFSFPTRSKWIQRAGYAACALLLLVNMQHFYYVAITHADLERVYTASLRVLQGYLEDGDVLYYQDGSGEVEPPVATSLYLNNLRNMKATVIGLGTSYGAGPEVGLQENWRENNPQPGDYLVAYDNVRSNPAHIRAASPANILRPEESLLQRGVEMDLLAEDEIRRPLPDKYFLDISWPQSLAGYRVYRVTQPGNPGTVKGLLQDGWTEKDFYILNSDSNQITLYIAPVSFQFFPENEIIVEIDGVAISTIPITPEREEIDLSAYLPMPEQGKSVDIHCIVRHTLSEIRDGATTDPRDLGLNLSVSFGAKNND